MKGDLQAGSWTTPIPAQTGSGHEICDKMVKILESKTVIFGGYYETFTKTLDLIYYALVADEEAYMKLVGELKPEAVYAAAEVSAMLVKAFCVDYVYDDYLGVVYQRLSHNDKRLGQFFTPWNVAYLLASLNLGDVKNQIKQAKKDQRKITIYEPSVGSGVMLLACKRLIIEQAGLAGLDYFEFSGTDIDRLCVKMAKVHMILTNYRYMTVRLSALLPQNTPTEEAKPVEAPPLTDWMK